jgi:hypothetical protein
VPTCPSDHDDDVVYFSDGEAAVGTSSRLKLAAQFFYALCFNAAVPATLSVPEPVSPCALPPPLRWHVCCPIFLQTLTLLI